MPGRLVVSAKSWLCHSGVDRTAGLLPWHGAADVREALAGRGQRRYLAHIRAAWDHAHPEHPLAEQDVVLSVPASFDEVARELTVQAARQAGLVQARAPRGAAGGVLRVDQRPRHAVGHAGAGRADDPRLRRRRRHERLHAHPRPARRQGGKVLFHRVAVGEHLILGGDNLDLALAHHVEQQARRASGGKLDAAAVGAARARRAGW